MFPEDAEVMLERLVDTYVQLEKRLTKIAYYLAEHGEGMKAGQIAVMATCARQFAAHMDTIAADYNSRPRKDGLHGVREGTQQQASTHQQMPLL